MSQLSFGFAERPRAHTPPPTLGRPIFVVPTERHVERLTGAGYRATTLPALEERLLASLAPELSVATRAEERAALAAIAPRLPGRGRVDPTSPALAAACESALDDLAAFVDELEPRRVASLGGLAHGPRAARIRLLAALEGALSEELGRHGLVARRHLATRLAALTASLSPAVVADALGSHVLETRLLVDLSPRRLLLLKALDRRLGKVGGRASVCLPTFDRPVDPSRAPDPLEALTAWTASWLDDAPRTDAIPARLGTLDDAPPLAAAAAGVEVRFVVDAESHAHAITEAVVSALDAGACIDDVAIGVVRWSEPHLTALGRALAEVGIPAHGLPLPGSALRAFVFEALAALDEPGPRALAALLASPYVDASLSPAERRRRARVVRALRRAPRARLPPDEAVAESLRSVAPEEVEGVTRVYALFAAFPSEGTMVELAAASLAFFRALGVASLAGRADPGAFSSNEDAPSARLEREAVARDARSWASVEAALASIAEAWRRLRADHVVVSRRRFIEELAALVPTSSALPGASRAFALRVVDLRELAGEELSLLVLADASGRLGAEPRSPLVTGEILRTLGAGGAEEAKAIAGLALAASRAERVVVTVAATDDDSPVDVAPFVSRLLRAGVAQSTWGAGSRLERPLTLADDRAARALAGVALADPSVAERVAVERAREGFFLDERRPLSPCVGAFAPTEEFTRAVAEDTGVDAARPLAVTGLERLAECPFRGFAHVVLGARDAPEEAEVPTPRDEGASLHAALAVALEASRALLRARPRLPADILAVGLDAARVHLAGEPASALGGVLAGHVLHRVEAVLREAALDDEWDFEVAEQAFGEPTRGSWPGLAVADDLAVRGRIDRVDLGRTRAAVRVVDYKRGATEEVVKHLGSTALQVPLYALAAQEATGAQVVKGIYLSLRDLERGSHGARRRGEEVFERVLAEGEAVASALSAVRRVRGGDLAPRPVQDTHCRTCPFAGGCRRPRFAMPAEEELAGAGSPEGGA